MTYKQIERISHIKKKTYNNVLLVDKLISKKGYNKEESLQIALNCFEQFENGHSNHKNQTIKQNGGKQQWKEILTQ